MCQNLLPLPRLTSIPLYAKHIYHSSIHAHCCCFPSWALLDDADLSEGAYERVGPPEYPPTLRLPKSMTDWAHPLSLKPDKAVLCCMYVGASYKLAKAACLVVQCLKDLRYPGQLRLLVFLWGLSPLQLLHFLH